jgi:hypothetical protein
VRVEFTKKFESQVAHLRDDKLKLEIANAVRSVMAANALHDIPHLKKLSGLEPPFVFAQGTTESGSYIKMVLSTL